MIDASGQRKPLQAPQVIEFGALKISSERDGDVVAICVSGELDLATASRLQRELERVEACDVRSIILDLSGLTFMDSTGIRLLLSAHNRSRRLRPPDHAPGIRCRTARAPAHRRRRPIAVHRLKQDGVAGDRTDQPTDIANHRTSYRSTRNQGSG